MLQGGVWMDERTTAETATSRRQLGNI